MQRVLVQSAVIAIFAFAIAVACLSTWRSIHYEKGRPTEQSSAVRPAEESYGPPPSQRVKWSTEEAIARYNLWLTIFTGALAFVALLQIGFMFTAARTATKAANAAKQSADVAREALIATQRAWLTANVSIEKEARITFDPNGAVLSTRIEMKNVGNAPATKVSWHAWLLPLGHTQETNFFHVHAQRCDVIRKQPFGIGPTIFPHDQYPHSGEGWAFGVGIGWNEIDIAFPPVEGIGNRYANLVLAGCVDYTFPSDSATHHQTGFVFYIFPTQIPIPKISRDTGNITSEPVALRPVNLTFEPGAN